MSMFLPWLASGAKAHQYEGADGTAEAVPLRNRAGTRHEGTRLPKNKCRFLARMPRHPIARKVGA